MKRAIITVSIFHVAVLRWQAHAVQVARQHYSLQLKRKVWQGWHGLVQKRWKTKVERACRSRAEEVCSHLSAEYEAKLAEVNKIIKNTDFV